MDDESMAGSFVAQDLLAAFADFLVVVLAVEGEDRGEFFIGIGMAATDTVLLTPWLVRRVSP